MLLYITVVSSNGPSTYSTVLQHTALHSWTKDLIFASSEQGVCRLFYILSFAPIARKKQSLENSDSDDTPPTHRPKSKWLAKGFSRYQQYIYKCLSPKHSIKSRPIDHIMFQALQKHHRSSHDDLQLHDQQLQVGVAERRSAAAS